MTAVGRNRKQLASVPDRRHRLALARELGSLQDRTGLATLTDLATASGIHVATVRRALNADSVPDRAVVEQIADATRADARTRNRLENLWRDARLEARPAGTGPGPWPPASPPPSGTTRSCARACC